MTISTSWVAWSASDPSMVVQAEPDLVLPRYATLEVRDEPSMRFDVDLSVYYDPSTWRYTVDHARLMKRDRWDSSIDTASLRDLRVQDLLRRGLTPMAWIGEAGGDRMPERLTDEQAAAIRAMGPSSDDALRWVSRLYTRAWALHQPPAQEVQEQLGLTRPTTSVWLRRARDRGLLTEPTDRRYDEHTPAARRAHEVLRDWDWDG